ncbi:ABC transporter ATP-binding protein [Pseudobacteriovorax antillogorgiicola]|uniref:Putative ABC transport system ATP-binding protein n=1 Tax=Pseudobacteriovorax antillogorgiicola TaxID=1513793 RepID=A0A1Y6BJI2_9BACT|nr:ABC transporter ATP-binding protein [Pseudobacteriovorax antillogorgiicola]TCS55545.1 putative ABC transport system ATP-binding protein [Pseudobacteriovorax antillogorgiicola]SMF11150.1 putative ABC transport system ATP-binding protein [Pseudobacteriovorax antillogorgiicola]
MDSVIAIKDLEFSYTAAADPILRIAAFQVKHQEHVFLHGPSGSGKTTLLGLITGILTSRRGQLAVLGTQLSDLSLRQRDKFRGSHLGYIFQMFNLIPYLNVEENILLPLKMNRSKREACPEPERELSELLSELRIEALRKQPVHSLSIGQQQRVAAARSLMGQPKLIVADEPTSALDYDSREAFLQLLFRSADRHNSTILFVSHDHSLASLFPRHVALKDINSAGGSQ